MYNLDVPQNRITRAQKIAPEKLQRARELRRRMTREEAFLWNALRRDQLGVHFRRQQIIQGFIADFYCAAAHLVIEIDGAVHQTADQRAGDAARDRAMRHFGLRVVRFKNRRIEQNLPQVIEDIKELLSGRTWGLIR